MSWLLVNPDNSLVSTTPSDTEPTPTAEERVVEVALGYPDTVAWSQADGGFVDKVVAQPLITVGRFWLLLTQAERIAIRAAGAQSPEVADFLAILPCFTDGISLADPAMVGALGELQAAGLLTADRAAAILAGAAPS